MAVLCPVFEGIVAKCTCPEEFDEWLVTQGLVDAVDFATMCDSEAACDLSIIAPAEADGVVFKPLVFWALL